MITRLSKSAMNRTGLLNFAIMLVVADTSPPNYLILVQSAQCLPALYGRVAIPPAEVLAQYESKHSSD